MYPAAGSSANSVASSSTAHEVVKDVAEKVAKRREKKQSVKIPAGTGIGEQEPTLKGKERSKKENLKAAPTLVPLEEDQSQPSLPPMLQPAPPMSDSTPLPKVKPKKKVKLAVPGSDPPYTPSPASSSSLPSKASSRTLPSQPSQPSAQPTTAGTSLSSAAAIAAVPSKKISSKSAETPAPHLADGPATPMKESSLPLDSTTSRKRPRSTPSPDSSPASTAKQATQHVKKKKRTSDDPVPYSASPAPTVSDAASPAPIIPNADAIVQKVLHSLIQRFKPSVPSPLSKASEMTPKAPEMTPSSSTPVNREKVKRLRRTRKKSSASALPTPLILAAVESEFSPAKVAVDLRETSSGRTTPQPWSLSEPRHFFNRLSEKDSTPERSSSSFDEVSPNMKRNKRRSRNSEQEVRQSEEANERQSTGDSREGRPDSEVVEAGPEKIEGAGDDSVSDVLADSGRDLSGGSNEKAQEAPPIVEPPISKKTVKRKPKQKVGTAEIAPHDVVIPTASNAARSSSAAATTPPASSPVPETLPSETAEPCIPARVAKPVKASRKSTPASSGALEKKRIMDAYRAKLAAQQATSGTEAARSVSSPDPPFEATGKLRSGFALQEY